MPQSDVFTDASPASTGTPLTAVNLDTSIAADSMIVSGGIPVPSGTLVLGQPAVVAIVNPGSGGLATRVALSNTTLTFTASRDTYVDLTTAGAYVLASVANGATAPALTANSIRLYQAIANGSVVTAVNQLAGGTAVDTGMVSAADETAVNDTLTPTSTLANTLHRIFYRLGQVSVTPTQSTVSVDASEASTLDTLSGGNLLSNMNRLRSVVASNLMGMTWGQALTNTQKAILTDGTNASSTLALPYGTTIGGVTPMLADGSSAGSAVTMAGTTTVNNLQIGNILLGGPGAVGVDFHGRAPTIGAFGAPISNPQYPNGRGSVSVSALSVYGTDHGFVVTVTVSVLAAVAPWQVMVQAPITFSTPFYSPFWQNNTQIVAFQYGYNPQMNNTEYFWPDITTLNMGASNQTTYLGLIFLLVQTSTYSFNGTYSFPVVIIGF